MVGPCLQLSEDGVLDRLGHIPVAGVGRSRSVLLVVGLPSGDAVTLEFEHLSDASEQIGDLALTHQIAIHELTPQKASLEQAFMELTNESVEYHGGTTIGGKSAA